MAVRSTPLGPAKFAFGFANSQIVNAGMACFHQATLVEFPVFITVRTKPVAITVMPFVGEAHSNTLFIEYPKFLDQSVVNFSLPFAL